MVHTNIHAVPTPQQWLKATSLTLFKRDDYVKDVDQKYERWFNTFYVVKDGKVERWDDPKNLQSGAFGGMVDSVKKDLRESLERYVASNGSTWEQCRRNRASKGLMAAIYKLVEIPAPFGEREAIRRDNIHARMGVLHLLGNISISVDTVKATIGFVTGTAGAATALASTDFKKWDSTKGEYESRWTGATLKDKDNLLFGNKFDKNNKLLIEGPAGVGGVRVNQVAMGVDKAFSTAADFTFSNDDGEFGFAEAQELLTDPLMEGSADRYVKKSHFQNTQNALKARAGRGRIVGGLAVAGAVVVDVFAEMYKLLEGLVMGLVSWVYEKFKSALDDPLESVYAQIKFWTKKIVSSLAEKAVPFVGAGFDIADGLIQSFKAIREKFGAWKDRQHIKIMEGHPDLICQRIEKVMETNMAAGLWSIIKGAIQMALAATIPGIQSLVSALTSGVETIIKLALKLMEGGRIKRFLITAQAHYKAALENAIEVKEGAATSKKFSSKGLIGSTKEFGNFFQEACEASPILAMLTINSGICGSQWQFQDLLDAPGQEAMQRQFDHGTAYFDRLKQFGRAHLKDAGFNVVAIGDKKMLDVLLKRAMDPGPATHLGSVAKPPPVTLSRGTGSRNLLAAG